MTLLTRIIRTSCLLLGLLWLEPIESGSEAEDTHEAGGGLLIAGRHRAPLFQPRPEPLHVVAIGVNPLWAGDRTSGPAPHAHLAPCCWPPFFCARRLLVSPDAGAIEKRHPQLNPALLGQKEQPLPHTQVGPADEHLSGP